MNSDRLARRAAADPVDPVDGIERDAPRARDVRHVLKSGKSPDHRLCTGDFHHLGSRRFAIGSIARSKPVAGPEN
jgi:hypothetical protein